jgi:anti-sigma factor ChrR (cupin superfamily)
MDSSLPGVAQKALYQQAGFHDTMRLERWDPQTDLGTITYERGVEFFVLAGGFADDAGAYSAGCWMRLPAGSEHHPRSAHGCTLYIKTAGLSYLRSAAA